MDYCVRFVGHIDELKRPENFPKEVYLDALYRVNNEAELKTSINNQSAVFMAHQAMAVFKDSNAVQEFGKAARDTRMLVPMHMITHITTITTLIAGEIPEISSGNVLEFMDGTKASIN
jgi:hypothetical protein